MKDPWPFPADTSLDRARKIAQSYRNALLSVDPKECQVRDQKARDLGQAWVAPFEISGEYDDDQVIEAELRAVEIAQLLHIPAATIRAWGTKGKIERLRRDGTPVYRLSDVLDLLAEIRAGRVA